MNRNFYETYWAGSEAAPDHDSTTPDRKRRLLESLRQSSIQPGAKVLDAGCGAGIFCAALAEGGFSPVGVDISQAAIDRARREHPGPDFRLLNPDFTLPVGTAEFDAVWSSEVIEHVFDVHAYLAELNRVLKPGGLLVLTTPFHGRLKNVAISLLGFDRHFNPDGGHIRFFDRQGLERCLTRAGFEPTRWSGLGRCWPVYKSWFVSARRAGPPGPPPRILG